jgi:eukaryotic-like serine/threonine-protein kinase
MENLPDSPPPTLSLGEKPEPASLETVMADYLQRLEQGQSPDPATYLRTFPQHSVELQSFFRNHHWLGASQPTTSPLIGAQIGPYVIESEIARGGMGVVYRAKQQGLERPVALKLISNGVLAGHEERRRFRIEAEAAAGLHHPGIIAIHEIGSWQGYEYFSMQLVAGPTLQQRVDDGVFDDVETARLVRDISRAVAYAHRAGIVHRDLKPENILICDGERPLVTDFGLAKWHREGTMVTRTGQVLGTPHYMSPEQATGRGESDASTDIYSLGAILYALLTGRPPHVGNSAAEVLRSVLQDEPQAPRHHRRDVPVDLEKICLKAIQFDPARRYETADDLADDLECYLAGEPTSATSSGLLDRVAREIQRDQHQTHFEDWGRTLARIGVIIFLSHVAMFALDQYSVPRWGAFWLPRILMLLGILGTIYYARDGSLMPRSVAERPVWSIWLAYLVTLGVMNLLSLMNGIEHTSLFPIASSLSGFGFIAMAGHVWGGSAIFGLGFLIVAGLAAAYVSVAPLLFGTMWLISLLSLARHYRVKRVNR